MLTSKNRFVNLQEQCDRQVQELIAILNDQQKTCLLCNGKIHTLKVKKFGNTLFHVPGVQHSITILKTMLIALILKGVKSGYFYWLQHSNKKMHRVDSGKCMFMDIHVYLHTACILYLICILTKHVNKYFQAIITTQVFA